jgi:hypothetical protein
MALKNYTTKVPANRSIMEIQEMLQIHGATGVLTEYEKDTGRIASLSFRISVAGQDWGFRLPMQWREAQRSMIADGNRRAYTDDDYCYRVAWRITRDWVDVQMALVDLKTADLQQIFLPYTVTQNGKTLYEAVMDNPKFLLGGGVEDSPA